MNDWREPTSILKSPGWPSSRSPYIEETKGGDYRNDRSLDRAGSPQRRLFDENRGKPPGKPKLDKIDMETKWWCI